MASFGQILFGLREVKIYNTDGSGALAFPVAMLMHVTPRINTEEFTVEDIVVGVRSFIVACDWECEAGSLELSVFGKWIGQSVINAGSTPNRTVTLNASAGIDFPYVRISGRVTDDSTGDTHCKLFKCKLTSIEGSFRNGQFHVLSAAGVAINDSILGVMEYVQHESAISL